MKKLLLTFSFHLPLLLFLFLLIPPSINGQGYIHCYVDSFSVCNLDLAAGGADCNEPDYIAPERCSSNPATCCVEQPSESCSNVVCIASAPTPSPAPECPVGQICTGLDPGLCISAGGDSVQCSTPSGGSGTCCQPDEEPGADSCPAGRYCTYILGGDSCHDNGGTTSNCSGPEQPSGGNCCLPRAGIYSCYWSGATCTTNTSGSPYPYTCAANFGHCTLGDPGCVACEDPSMQNPGSCENGNPHLCIEQNETIGYRCVDTTTGCYPCFEYNADPTNPGYEPTCNPPEYTDFTSCDLACSGQVPTRFGCNEHYQCVEMGNGPFASMGECYCFGNLFCTESGDITTEETGILNTAIGCVPVDEIVETTAFLVTWLTAIAGGIALALLVYSGILIMVSSGDPRKLAAGKELFTATISGLLLLILSMFILRFVGVDWLQIITGG